MNINQFLDQFENSLEQNPFDDNGFNGCLFETYGDELDHVKHTDGKVYTLVEVDGDQYVEEGFHHVNRLGYFIVH